jgi:hypothetical protein
MKLPNVTWLRARRLTAGVALAGALGLLSVALPAQAAEQYNGVGHCVSAYNHAQHAAGDPVISGLTSVSDDVPALMDANFRGQVCPGSDDGGGSAS